MEAFSSQEFIDKMVEYLCFEENKGKDRYKSDKAMLFKVCLWGTLWLYTWSEEVWHFRSMYMYI